MRQARVGTHPKNRTIVRALSAAHSQLYPRSAACCSASCLRWTTRQPFACTHTHWGTHTGTHTLGHAGACIWRCICAMICAVHLAVSQVHDQRYVMHPAVSLRCCIGREQEAEKGTEDLPRGSGWLSAMLLETVGPPGPRTVDTTSPTCPRCPKGPASSALPRGFADPMPPARVTNGPARCYWKRLLK